MHRHMIGMMLLGLGLFAGIGAAAPPDAVVRSCLVEETTSVCLARVCRDSWLPTCHAFWTS
jgi:hypothetical protein